MILAEGQGIAVGADDSEFPFELCSTLADRVFRYNSAGLFHGQVSQDRAAAAPGGKWCPLTDVDALRLQRGGLFGAEHQDSVLTRERLRELARHTASTEAAFLYGRLHAQEEARSEGAQRRFDEVWKAARRKRLRRWLR